MPHPSHPPCFDHPNNGILTQFVDLSFSKFHTHSVNVSLATAMKTKAKYTFRTYAMLSLLHVVVIFVYLVLSMFIARKISLVPYRRISVRLGLLFMLFIFVPDKLTLSVKTCASFGSFSSNLFSFSWTCLIAYYRTKLKSSGDKASPCLNPL
jgi:hypothetical protein